MMKPPLPLLNTMFLTLFLGCVPALAQPRGAVIASCAACHGEDGIAREADVPHLAGQNEVYMLNQMANFRNGSRRHPEMRFIARDLGPQDIKDIITYYAALPAR